MRAASVISGMTLLSRVLGMVRDIVTAAFFGTTWLWDAFVYAFMFPNFFRRVIGEGAISSAFIPVYSSVLAQKGKEEAFRFANIIRSYISGGLLIITLLVYVILSLCGYLDLGNPTLALTLSLLKILFPYLLFMSLYALGMGVLHSHQKFFAPTIGPVLLNIIWILTVVFFLPRYGDDSEGALHLLALAVLGAGILHVTTERPALYKIGFQFKWIWDKNHESVKKFLKLLFPVILSFAVVQINVLCDMTLAMVIGEGASSSLWYGTRVMQLPLGVFAIAIVSAILPQLSKQISSGNIEASKATLSHGLRMILFIMIPASIGLMVLAEPIIQCLFERGEFDRLSTFRTSSVLMAYSLGLFAYSGLKVLTAGFHASQDSKTPMKISVYALVLNIVLNLVLMIPFKEMGLALATSIAAIFQFVLLLRIYPKKVSSIPLREVWFSCRKVLVLSTLVGIMAHYSFHFFQSHFSGFTGLCFSLFSAILLTVAFYLLGSFLVKSSEFKDLRNIYSRTTS